MKLLYLSLCYLQDYVFVH